MSDHDFEKQVRQKLNNLKISPSAEAWGNIEERIRQQRRRRAPFIWLPLLLAGTLAGIYLISRSPEQPSGSGRLLSGKIGTGTPGPASAEVSGLVEKKNAADPGARTGSVSDKAGISHLPPAAPLSTSNYQSNSLNAKHGQILLLTKSRSKNSVAAAAKEDTGAEAMTTPAKDRSGAKTIAPASTNQPGNPIPQSEKMKKAIISARTPDSATTAISVASKPADRKRKNSKWSIAVDAYSGVVAVNEGGLLSLNKPKVEDVAYRANFRNAVPSYAPQQKPSTISPGIAFSAGVEVKRELSHRFSISAGLNYTQFNTRSKVGERVNSSQIVNNGVRGYLYVQSYYLLDPNENVEYKNKYHFLTVPVTLHTRINNSEKLPIYWNAGLVVSRLLSSTSLHFDGSTGVYYKNDRLLNQTQMGLTTGFSFALFNKTTHPLWIGPSALSNVSTILKKDISASKHFVTLGLDVKWFLKR